jgi:hypothetical protein
MDKGSALERLWVSLLDSRAFRRFSREGVGSEFFHSRFYRQASMLKNRLSSLLAVRTHPDRFRDVRTFCLFIGHNKSGTSLLGSLLDAHPEIILADEVGALNYLLAGFKREQIFHLLVKGSRREEIKGRVTARRLVPYSYKVPGQYQGRYIRLRVIGDGKAGSTTQLFGLNPGALKRLQVEMDGLNLRFIQTIRNPFDPISVMMVRGKRTFENSIGHYFTSCEMLSKLREQIGPENLISVRYEEFVRDPEDHLERLAAFLGVDALQDWICACASILRAEPDVQRNMVHWQPEWIRMVESNIQKYDFLQGYSFKAV